jgi:hypothetical protein
MHLALFSVTRLPLALCALLLAACASAPTTEPEPAGPVAPAPAIPPPPPAPEDRPFEACARPATDEVPILDETSRRLHETVCGAALWFDGLFGDGDLRAARRARGRLEVATSYSEFEGDDTRVRFSARVPFPALRQRLSAFVGVDDDDDVARDRAEGVGLSSKTSALDEAESFFAGLGYVLSESWGIRTDFRVGVRGLRNTRAFAQLRASHTAYVDADNRIELRLTPFYNTRDGAGATASTDFDHSLSPTRLLRWGSVGTVSENTQGLDWRTALILYQSLGHLRALGFEVFERGATAAPEPLGEYGVRTIYREPLFEARLFANLVLGYSWPRIDPALPREGAWNVSVGFELPYGDRRP